MLGRTLLGIAAIAASSTAFSATQTWNLQSQGNNINNNQLVLNNGGVTLTISAWSSTLSGTCNSGPECGGGNANDPDPFISQADLKGYSSGLGAVNSDEGDDTPNHAFDSIYGSSASIDHDMALLQFSEDVTLDTMRIGYFNTDSDMSVLTYTGNGTPTPFSSSSKWSDLLNQGWSFVNHYSDVQVNQNRAISSSVESQYWLVGVYNPAFQDNGWSIGNDSFKLAGLSSSNTPGTPPPPGIPEPATALLFVAGLIGLSRRQKRA